MSNIPVLESLLARERVRWQTMIASCYNPSEPSWHNHGKYGVNVDSKWMDFHNFINDVGLAPEGFPPLDRIPGTYQFNRKTTTWRVGNERILTLHNVSKSIKGWSFALGIPVGTICSRIGSNRPVEEVLSRVRLPNRDLSDRKFSKLTVMSFHKVKGEWDFWNCRCDCGKRIIVASWLLQKGVVRSCGCIPASELSQKKVLTNVGRHINKGTKHESLLTGLPEATIANRKNKGYCPADQRSPIRLPRGKLWEYGNQVMSISQWATFLGVSENAINSRLRAGWPFEDVVNYVGIL